MIPLRSLFPKTSPKHGNFWTCCRRGSEAPAIIEKRYRRKDGRLLSARVSATLRRDLAGHPSQIIAIVEDITERKRVEAALREGEARFRSMANSAPVLIWIADTTRQYTWFNRPWLEFNRPRPRTGVRPGMDRRRPSR